ncbi:MAG: hypothetical protein AB1736_03365 [Chloroflexota bacterium]
MIHPTRRAMSLALALSWASMLAHNLFELPLTPLDVENSGPLVVDVLLAAAFALRPSSRVIILPIAIWAFLNLVVGGIITVLPLTILPFVPEQTIGHYLAHVVYALGQVPLVLLSTTALKPSGATRPELP